MNKFNSRIPRYNDDSDYTTNAPSYYDDLARKTKLIEILSKRIYEYDETLKHQLEDIKYVLENYIEIIDNKIKDGFNDEIKKLLVKWVDDGTLNHIINVEIFGELNDELLQLGDTIIYREAL